MRVWRDQNTFPSSCEGGSFRQFQRRVFWGEKSCPVSTMFLIFTQPSHTLVFIDHSDTCASFLASSSWNTHLVQQQRVWGEYVQFIQTWASVCSFFVIVSSSQNLWGELMWIDLKCHNGTDNAKCFTLSLWWATHVRH